MTFYPTKKNNAGRILKLDQEKQKIEKKESKMLEDVRRIYSNQLEND
jgi:hypothetical protein